MKQKMWALILVIFFGFLKSSMALAENGCPDGSYSVAFAPDGSAMSVIFDRFVLESGAQSGTTSPVKTCKLEIPLRLPPDTSLGVYRVDYRGYAFLQKQQNAELSVLYTVGKRQNKSREIRRKIKGPFSADYFFSESLPPGILKRVGCGEKAEITMDITLILNANRNEGQAIATLDSFDQAHTGAFFYRFDYAPCPKKPKNQR